MKSVLFTFFTLILGANVFAQSPLVKRWDYRYGGSTFELLSSFQQTSDGGYILGGSSNSPLDGDISQPNRDSTNDSYDYWIVRTDARGIKLWDKRFGGEKDEKLYSIIQTNDGGFILGGVSSSGVSGDRTEANWDTTEQTFDYWIVKTDSLGNKLWDKRFGGSNSDFFYSLCLADDGGYLLGGASVSGISGDKTQSNWDPANADFWIVKIDSAGGKQWERRFGGNREDYLYSVIQTCDGGFLLGGISRSDSTGDKTQNAWRKANGLPSEDYWIIKIDRFGTKEWDERFGGSGNDVFSSVAHSRDGGYILGGVSESVISGDKTKANYGGSDFWIIKLDSAGNKQWDKCYGGRLNEDEFGSIAQTCDMGYLLAGTSYSGRGGDKSENNLGLEQTWIVKIDSDGAVQWDKTLKTDYHDEAGFAIEVQDGCYVMASYTLAGNAGDKTQLSQGLSDIWFTKFCDTTSISCTAHLFTCDSWVGINSVAYEPAMTVFPNPVSTDLVITIQKENLRQIFFSLNNILGESVFKHQEINLSNPFTYTVNLSGLSSGIYLFDVFVDGQRKVKKIVKE